MKFEIELKEILSRIVTVEAKTEREAKTKVLEKYRKQEIILDDSDFSGELEIRVIKK